MSVTTCSAAETIPRMGLRDLATTRGWGLTIKIFLADVNLSISEFEDNIAGVPLGVIDHWIPGSQWL